MTLKHNHNVLGDVDCPLCGNPHAHHAPHHTPLVIYPTRYLAPRYPAKGCLPKHAGTHTFGNTGCSESAVSSEVGFRIAIQFHDWAVHSGAPAATAEGMEEDRSKIGSRIT